MIEIKTLNEAILSVINNIHDALPEVDTKEGTWLRDIVIDPVSNEVSDIYDDLYKMEMNQSVLTCTGSDLDRLATNYFIKRKQGTKSTGKVRFYIKNTNKDIADIKFPDIRIPQGTILSTKGTLANPMIQFQTLDDIFIAGTSTTTISSSFLSNLNTLTISGIAALPRDNTGYRYIEILCESLTTGKSANIAPYQIVSQSGAGNGMITDATNPYSFNGGTDPEDDISLALRISMAISGANIGTKDGYLSYTLKQPQILDAYIVGAGDPYMQRDVLALYNSETGVTTNQHIGGKVDIYVRTNSEIEDSFLYTVTQEDLDNEFNVPNHIKFPAKSYPIVSLTSIIGKIKKSDGTYKYKNYINAEDYELERTTTGDSELYYVDIPWDFSVKNSFPDEEYYFLPAILTEEEIVKLKTKLDNELILANEYLNNLSYKINWDLIDWVEPRVSSDTKFTTLFTYGQYSDDQFYKLKIKSDTPDGVLLGGRVFVKKQDTIYVRIYVTPDFKLVRDSGLLEGSVKALDYISWLERPDVKNVPEINEELSIKFVCNSGIIDLQEGLETKRVMTADVLIKAAKEKDVEIALSIICSPSYDPDIIKGQVGDAITNYVNNEKKLGGYLDASDLVYIVKSIDGILSVNIDTTVLSFVGYEDCQTIRCNPDEYFNLKNLILEVTNKGM